MQREQKCQRREERLSEALSAAKRNDLSDGFDISVHVKTAEHREESDRLGMHKITCIRFLSD